MPRTKRAVEAAADEGSIPPNNLASNHSIMRISKPAGNNLYSVTPAAGEEILVEMPSRFRSAIYVKRGSFVIVDTGAFGDRTNKLGGEIVAIIRNEREWRKQAYWPSEFAKKQVQYSDEEDSLVGKLPPSDSETEL